MDERDRWDSLIRHTVTAYWPALDWRYTKAQAIAESALDARVVSPAGAVGLLQLMEAAFQEAAPNGFRERPREDPEANLAAGVIYLKTQFKRLPEFPDTLDRLLAATASYNCGRGYVNAALRLLRSSSPNATPTWANVRPLLARAEVRGRTADFSQVWKYVERVRELYQFLAVPHWRGFPVWVPRRPIS